MKWLLLIPFLAGCSMAIPETVSLELGKGVERERGEVSRFEEVKTKFQWRFKP